MILTSEKVELCRQGLLDSDWCGFSKRATVNALCDLALKGLSVQSESGDIGARLRAKGYADVPLEKQPAHLRQLIANESVPSAERFGADPEKLRAEAALLPGLKEALLWKPNTPQLENAMTYAWEQALKSFIRAIEKNAPSVPSSVRATGPYKTGEPEDDEGSVTVLDSSGNALDADDIVALLNTYSKLAVADLSALSATKRTCTWYLDGEDSDCYATGCGQHYVFHDGTLEECEARYCQGCGGKINLISAADSQREDGQA